MGFRNLADISQDGRLDLSEFIVAMALVSARKDGKIQKVPETLPRPLANILEYSGTNSSVSPVMARAQVCTLFCPLVSPDVFLHVF